MNRNAGLRIGLLAFSLVFVCGMAVYLALRETRAPNDLEFYTLSDTPSDTAGEPSGDLSLESIAAEASSEADSTDAVASSAASSGVPPASASASVPSDAGGASVPAGTVSLHPPVSAGQDGAGRTDSSQESAEDPVPSREDSDRLESAPEEDRTPDDSDPLSDASSTPQSSSAPPASSQPASSSAELPASSAPPVSSEPPASSDASSAPSETPEVVRLQNIEFAEQLQSRYHITIRLVSTSGSKDAMVAAPEADPFRMRDLLQMTETALSVFPDTFFDHSLTIVLAGRLNAASAVAGDSTGDSGVVWVASDQRASSLLLDWILDFAAACFVRRYPMDFAEYNPANFYYGAVEGRYVYSSRNPYGGYFLSEDAQRNPAADQKELFRALFTQPSLLEQVPEGCAMHAKVTALCETAVAWRPCLSVHRTVRLYLFS